MRKVKSVYDALFEAQIMRDIERTYYVAWAVTRATEADRTVATVKVFMVRIMLGEMTVIDWTISEFFKESVRRRTCLINGRVSMYGERLLGAGGQC